MHPARSSFSFVSSCLPSTAKQASSHHIRNHGLAALRLERPPRRLCSPTHKGAPGGAPAHKVRAAAREPGIATALQRMLTCWIFTMYQEHAHVPHLHYGRLRGRSRDQELARAKEVHVARRTYRRSASNKHTRRSAFVTDALLFAPPRTDGASTSSRASSRPWWQKGCAPSSCSACPSRLRRCVCDSQCSLLDVACLI